MTVAAPASARQVAIRFLSEAAPDQADAAIVPFLTSNPEQRIVTYVNDSSATMVSIGRELLAGLRDESGRTQWPVMISAMADLLGGPLSGGLKPEGQMAISLKLGTAILAGAMASAAAFVDVTEWSCNW